MTTTMQTTRHAVFLEEMGIGPLWTLRASTPAPESESEPVSALEASESAAAAMVAAPGEIAPQQHPAEVATASAPIAAAPVSAAAIAAMTWAELSAAVASCTRCDLCHSRKNTVPGRGASMGAGTVTTVTSNAAHPALWMVVGSAPALADEEEGMPVSGAAGQLLDNMLHAIGLVAQQVYVTNLVKCRPHSVDGMPTPQQSAACAPFLARELALLQATTGPGAMVLALGAPAARGIADSVAATLAADTSSGTGNLRGIVHDLGSSAMVVTLHPDELLREGKSKAQAWLDLCLARNGQAARDAL